MHDRGLVREGMLADLLVFDLARTGVREDEITRVLALRRLARRGCGRIGCRVVAGGDAKMGRWQ